MNILGDEHGNVRPFETVRVFSPLRAVVIVLKSVTFKATIEAVTSISRASLSIQALSNFRQLLVRCD